MKTETKYLKIFLDKFKDIVLNTEIHVQENGFVEESMDSTMAIWNRTILNKSVFINYQKIDNSVYLEGNRIDMLSKMCNLVNENVEISFTDRTIELVGLTKNTSLVLSAKPSGYKGILGKIWDDKYKDVGTEIVLKLKQITEIKEFIRTLKPDKVVFLTSNKNLEVRFEDEAKSLEAKIILASCEKEIQVKFSADLLMKVLDLIDAEDIKINISSSMPVRLRETTNILSTEYVLANLNDVE